MTQDEAISALLGFIFSGALGSPKGKGVGYALVESTPTTFSWWAALEDIDGPPMPLDRYLVKINRRTRTILPPEPIALSETELSEAILSATGRHLASSTRFTDGALSVSYKVTVQESPDIAYVVQLRHHGNVASMDSLMGLISKTADSHNLPVPPVYPIPGERRRQDVTGVGRQITLFKPGLIASMTYPGLPHDEKLRFVRKIALAFEACWSIRIPEPRLIGELIATDINGEVVLSVGPDRHYSLGDPFSSVREYLQAYIRSSLVALEKQQGIEEYKEKYLEPIRYFVNTRISNIPAIVEKVPIVAMHSDMGPHNIIVSSDTRIDIESIIDWEFVTSAPFASLYRVIEMFFSQVGRERVWARV